MGWDGDEFNDEKGRERAACGNGGMYIHRLECDGVGFTYLTLEALYETEEGAEGFVALWLRETDGLIDDF